MTAILSYKLASKSAKTLSKSLNWRRVRYNGTFRNNYRHTIVNWGCSASPNFPVSRIINKPEAVALASNKLKTLRRLTEEGVSTLKFFTDPTEAFVYQQEHNAVMFQRNILNGRSGNGITVVQPGEELGYAPLYTVFFDKTHEYRVHATKDAVFDFQAKLQRNGEEADPYVYSYDNGRVFCRNGIELPDEVAAQSVAAVAALGLDFGAVDVAMNDDGTVKILEVNSAPALEGSTIESYINMLRGML